MLCARLEIARTPVAATMDMLVEDVRVWICANACDGALLTTEDKGVINLWSLADLSKPPLNLSENEWGDVRTLRFSPDNRWLVSGTGRGTVNIWDVSGERPALEPRHRCRQGEGVREPAGSDCSARDIARARGERAACRFFEG
jgi:WD40 repeat protein